MRRGGLIALGVVVTLAAIFGLVAFLNSKEDSTIGAERDAPGVEAPSRTSDVLRKGNVVIVHGSGDSAPLEKLQADLGGDDPALVEAGQAVILEDGGSGGVLATAYQRELRVNSPTDPQLREFAEYWLGRGEQ